MGNTTELEVLEDVVRKLESEAFEYMLTGSMAMNYYAQPRMTRDVDIVVALTAADSANLIGLFRDDYYLSEDAVREAIRDHGMFNLLHLDAVVKIDIIVRKDEPYRQQEFARKQRIELAGFATWIVSKEDLILSKLRWAADSRSESQIRDVQNLLATGADVAYLRKWAPALGIEAEMEQHLRA